MSQSFSHFQRSAVYALVASITIVALVATTFFALEPKIGRAVDSTPFRVRQTITDETSFLVQPSNVTMDGSITGVTGGTANGSTTFVVISNNVTGYLVTIAYANNTGAHSMLGDATLSESIRDYSGDVGGFPSYNFTASTAAQFAYKASTTATDLPDAFLDNGALCNQPGGSVTADHCWKAPTTSSYTIVDRGSSSNTGATSTIFFRVVVPSGSVPSVTAGTYTATATLTLNIQ